jgi:hypothetical protein
VSNKITTRSGDQNEEAKLSPAIRRGRLDSLTIYDVTEAELELLERGSPDSIYFNVALALLSASISFTITIFTTTIASDRVYIFFITFMIIGYIASIVLLLLWWRSRKSASSVINNIRRRLPPEGIPTQIIDIEEKPEV